MKDQSPKNDETNAKPALSPQAKETIEKTTAAIKLEQTVAGAVLLGDVDALRTALDGLRRLGASQLRLTDLHQATPLMKAAEGGHADMVQLLIEWSDVNARDKWGNTALMNAADQGSLENVKLLAQTADVSALNNQGDAAVHMAARMDYVEIVSFFAGLGPMPASDLWKDTTLHIAAENGSIKCVKVLMELAKDALNNENSMGSTALCAAIDADHAEIAALLAPFSDLGSQWGDKEHSDVPALYAAAIGAEKCLGLFLPELNWRRSHKGRNALELCRFAELDDVKKDPCMALLEAAAPMDIARETLARNEKGAFPGLLARLEAIELAQIIAEARDDTKSTANAASGPSASSSVAKRL